MKNKSERGQATLEFLIIAPLVLVMVALIAYAGWYSYAKLSAQNAAYGWMIFLPTQKLNLDENGELLRVGGFWGARTETLHEPTGMKEMWGDTSSQNRSHSTHGLTRLGGASVTIWVFPGEINLPKRLEIARDEAEDSVPKGSAFFHFPPFITKK